MSRRDRNSGFFSGFGWGALLGAGLFFLLGTKKGRKIKNQLMEKGKELVDDLPKVVEDLEKQGEKLVRKAEEIKEKLEEKTQERDPEMASSVRKRFFTRKGRKLG